jgi:ribosomal protein S18 acetylase RimI-like enzyme
MSIHLQTNDSGISWLDVSNLFKAVGWGQRKPDDLRSAFAKSTFPCFAFDDAKLVGFGRTIDDGRYYATIVDIVIHPDYQRRGIGRQIMQNLKARMTGFLVVTLTAAPHVQPFYKKLGWRMMKTGMMFPRSEEQAKQNCE